MINIDGKTCICYSHDSQQTMSNNKTGAVRLVTTSPVAERKEPWTNIRTVAGSNLTQDIFSTVHDFHAFGLAFCNFCCLFSVR